MFTFAIWDRKNETLFCARDHFGIKPFYYYQNDAGELLFGSEIKSFLAHPGFKKELNEEQLPLYLSYQYSPGEDTFFKGVKKLMPAHWLEWKAGQLTVQRYWQPKFDPDDSRTLEEWEDEISAAMKESVQAHKIADVEVGSFLSSGVDSSYMAALAHVDKTFTVGFANKQYDETDYAQEFSKHIGVKNYAYRITPEEYWANLGKIQYHMDEPLADAGCDACVMEVSSQGIMMDRVAGIHYKVGVFTNLYPDHIGPGEHSSFEEYRSWKGKLFQRCDIGVVNADDPNTEALLEGHTCKLVTYGIHAPKVDYRASEQYRLLRNKEMLGVEFTLTEPDGHTLDVQVGMPGLFSIYNALATIGVGKVLGLADAPIHEGLKKALVKGRVELVPISHKFTILIDYAHNEAATESLIETLREYNPNRLVVVFGCGGNRSKLRRYGMGEVCAKLADFSILTEDNNRFEKVEDIIADIKTGMAKGNPDAKYVEIPDRLDALHYAIDHAQEGDLIAVIGKGHEAYRDREGVKTPFLERELIEEYAAETGVE